jgi:hypothetical protein
VLVYKIINEEREHAQIRREQGRRVSLLGHINEFPATITVDWVHGKLDRLDHSDSEQVVGASITQDEWESARGCNLMVYTLNPKHNEFFNIL